MPESLEVLHECLKDLETIRRDADAAGRQYGSLGDYIDRGHPNVAERRQAFEDMSAADARAREAVGRLKALIADLNRRIPGAVAFWAERHKAVCRLFLDGHPGPSAELSVIRHVAQETHEEWEKVAQGTVHFVGINEVYLCGYEEIFDLLDR